MKITKILAAAFLGKNAQREYISEQQRRWNFDKNCEHPHCRDIWNKHEKVNPTRSHKQRRETQGRGENYARTSLRYLWKKYRKQNWNNPQTEKNQVKEMGEAHQVKIQEPHCWSVSLASLSLSQIPSMPYLTHFIPLKTEIIGHQSCTVTLLLHPLQLQDKYMIQPSSACS